MSLLCLAQREVFIGCAKDLHQVIPSDLLKVLRYFVKEQDVVGMSCMQQCPSIVQLSASDIKAMMGQKSVINAVLKKMVDQIPYTYAIDSLR